MYVYIYIRRNICTLFRYTYIHTDRQTDRHRYIHTYVLTYLPTYLPTYLITYIHTSILLYTYMRPASPLDHGSSGQGAFPAGSSHVAQHGPGDRHRGPGPRRPPGQAPVPARPPGGPGRGWSHLGLAAEGAEGSCANVVPVGFVVGFWYSSI